jgi:hypothetical protein
LLRTKGLAQYCSLNDIFVIFCSWGEVLPREDSSWTVWR